MMCSHWQWDTVYKSADFVVHYGVCMCLVGVL